MDYDENVVFKKCKEEGREYLVVAKKPIDVHFVDNKPFQFLCNESRTNIGNKYFSKFRCNGLIILDIFDLETYTSVDSITHISVLNYWMLPSRTIYTEYTKGMLIQPDEYDDNIEGICRPGLHYFLSGLAALNYENGVSKGYDANGHMIIQYESSTLPIMRSAPTINNRCESLHTLAVITIFNTSSSSKSEYYERENNQRTGGQKIVLASKSKKQKNVIKVFKNACPIRYIQPKFRTKVSRYVGCLHQ